jgi:bacillithiol biosynthesis cysteine-adding enzyme BshC
MDISHIPFSQVPGIAARDLAYAQGDSRLRDFYVHTPALSSFEAVMEKRLQAPAVDRQALVEVLREQYAGLENPQPAALAQIEALLSPEAFTLTTAHQPVVLLGPLYVIYKAVSVINLARQLQQAYPDRHFVPVFVLGAEDHDFEEVSRANLFGHTLTWQAEGGGAVGLLPTAGMTELLQTLDPLLGESEAGRDLFHRLRAAYTGHTTFGDATRQLLNDFLGALGLVVIDMNHRRLKELFVPAMRREIFERISKPLVEETQAAILQATGFGPQAFCRDINLFFLLPGRRERIEWDGQYFHVLNTSLRFSPAEMEAELFARPEQFSPNVVMRPLYQETVLPNLAYVGGGGELAYWLERKTQFEAFGLPFPMLIRRNSVLWIDQPTSRKMDKAGLSPEDLLFDTDTVIRQYVEKVSGGGVQLEQEKNDFDQLFARIAEKAAALDPTLEKAVRAEYARQLKVIENLEERLMRTQKQKHEVTINQIRSVREKLFPGNGLQERYDNFVPYWLRGGEQWLSALVAVLDPLTEGLVVLREH